MNHKDFVRYAKSMDDYPYEIVMPDLDRIKRLSGTGWADSPPMLELMKAQRAMNIIRGDALDARQYTTGGLFSALGGIFGR